MCVFVKILTNYAAPGMYLKFELSQNALRIVVSFFVQEL